MAKKNTSIPKIDIHGLTVEDALHKLREFISKQPQNAEKVVVIHGYNNGTALKESILRQLHTPRIKEIAPSFLNPGETVIYLKR